MHRMRLVLQRCRPDLKKRTRTCGERQGPFRRLLLKSQPIFFYMYQSRTDRKRAHRSFQKGPEILNMGQYQICLFRRGLIPLSEKSS